MPTSRKLTDTGDESMASSRKPNQPSRVSSSRTRTSRRGLEEDNSLTSQPSNARGISTASKDIPESKSGAMSALPPQVLDEVKQKSAIIVASNHYQLVTPKIPEVEEMPLFPTDDDVSSTQIPGAVAMRGSGNNHDDLNTLAGNTTIITEQHSSEPLVTAQLAPEDVNVDEIVRQVLGEVVATRATVTGDGMVLSKRCLLFWVYQCFFSLLCLWLV